jgi:hypothetical protein
MTAAWNTVSQLAIHSWVATASGLPQDRVVWGGQNGPRPPTPFIEMRCAALLSGGIDWVDTRDAENPEPGLELEYLVRGSRTAELQLTCFGDAVGDQSSTAILDRVIAGAQLPSVKQALLAGRVGVGDSEPVTWLGRVINFSDFEPRAIVRVTLHLASEISELGTFVETTELVNELE